MRGRPPCLLRLPPMQWACDLLPASASATLCSPSDLCAVSPPWGLCPRRLLSSLFGVVPPCLASWSEPCRAILAPQRSSFLYLKLFVFFWFMFYCLPIITPLPLQGSCEGWGFFLPRVLPWANETETLSGFRHSDFQLFSRASLKLIIIVYRPSLRFPFREAVRGGAFFT